MEVQHGQGMGDCQVGIQVTGMRIRVTELIEKQGAGLSQKVNAGASAAHPWARDRVVQLVEDGR